MSFMRIFHVYTGSHFVVVVLVLVKQQKYTFNSTVNVEIMSKMFETLINQTLLQNISKKMLIEPYNDGKVNHFPVPH